MEFFCLLTTLMSLAGLAACSGTIGLSPGGSYIDTLLNGMRRMRYRAPRSQTLLTSVAANDIYNGCTIVCPVGTVCSLDLGLQRCVPAGRAALVAVGGGGYGEPVVQLASDHSVPIRGDLVVAGAAGYNGVGVGPTNVLVSTGHGAGYGDTNFGVQPKNVLVSSGAGYGDINFGLGPKNLLVSTGHGAGYGNSFGVVGCGVIPLACRANQLQRFDVNAVFKYTFDPSFNQCVRVTVCSSCAFVNGARDNLFDSLSVCRRSC